MTRQLITIWMAVAFLSLCLPRLTSAQPSDAQAQFNKAVEQAKAGEHTEAVKICLDVLGKLPKSEHSRVHKLLGFSYKGLQKLPEAWHHLSLYVGTTGTEDSATERWLEKVETELKKSHVKVVLSCEPKGAILTLKPEITASQPEYTCPLTWWVKPGKHSIRAAKTGFETRTAPIEVRERGDKGVHSISLKALKTPDNVETPTPTITRPKESNSSSTAGFVLIGSGAALGVVGAILNGIAYSKNNDLHDKYLPSNKEKYQANYDDQVKPKSIASYVLYGTGGAAIAAGIGMLLMTGGSDKGKNTPSLSFSPLTMPEGTGAMMTFEW